MRQFPGTLDGLANRRPPLGTRILEKTLGAGERAVLRIGRVEQHANLVVPVVALGALHPCLLRGRVVPELQQHRLPRLPPVVELYRLPLLEMRLEAPLAPAVVFEPVCVVRGVPLNLLEAACAAAEQGGRVEQAAELAAEGAAVPPLLLWLPVKL